MPTQDTYCPLHSLAMIIGGPNYATYSTPETIEAMQKCRGADCEWWTWGLEGQLDAGCAIRIFAERLAGLE